MSEEAKKDEAPAIDPKEYESLKQSVAALEKKNAELHEKRAASKKEADEAKKIAEEAARKSGDLDALEKSWAEKLTAETSSRDTLIDEYKGMLNAMTVGATAKGLAADLAVQGSSSVLQPHIEKRLTVELTDGKPRIRVLDKDGKPSAMTIDDLRAEIEADKAFAPLIAGSRANGGGSPAGKGSGDAKTVTRSAFEGMGAADRMAYIKAGGKVVDA